MAEVREKFACKNCERREIVRSFPLDVELNEMGVGQLGASVCEVCVGQLSIAGVVWTFPLVFRLEKMNRSQRFETRKGSPSVRFSKMPASSPALGDWRFFTWRDVLLCQINLRYFQSLIEFRIIHTKTFWQRRYLDEFGTHVERMSLLWKIIKPLNLITMSLTSCWRIKVCWFIRKENCYCYVFRTSIIARGQLVGKQAIKHVYGNQESTIQRTDENGCSLTCNDS